MKVGYLAMVTILASCSSPPVPEQSTAAAPEAEAATDAPLSVEDEFWPEGIYTPSPAQARADQSFSDIQIEDRLGEFRDRVQGLDWVHQCEDACYWQDTESIRYYTWADDDDSVVLQKWIEVADFENRAIPALGIGHTRIKDEVLARVEEFLPEGDITCHRLHGNCSLYLGPGWIRLDFDQNDQLEEVWLVGSHFT